jgi:hypothetical protein
VLRRGRPIDVLIDPVRDVVRLQVADGEAFSDVGEERLEIPLVVGCNPPGARNYAAILASLELSRA